MRRIAIPPRPDFSERARKLGFAFAETDGEPYWDESAYWRFSAQEIDTLDDATAELQRICLAAAEDAVRHARHETLGIPRQAWPLVVRSWDAREPSLYGRMDLRWDGTGPPHLLEYNADTPTALYEASVVQWEWLTTVCPCADQFNSIHERLIATWAATDWPGTVHFTCMPQSTEDRTTVEYLRDTAMQAGRVAPFLPLDSIGWDGERFVDLEDQGIAACFKLYPWEFLFSDAFGAHIGRGSTRWIEPAWRLLLSGKGLLALLWELFPGHPNLLPAFREPGRTGGPEIAKPLFAREGANIVAPGQSTGGPYGGQGMVFQQYAELPRTDGKYPVLGSWVVGGVPCGLGIREDATPITTDAARFVPHCFDPAGKSSRP
jgi:glutathionylspermidine synthase